MSETSYKLAPGVHDNHSLKLWHEWNALIAQNHALETEWRYERDETGMQLAGPGECLSRHVGSIHLRVILGGDGQYTPLAQMDDRHGVKLTGPERVITSISPARGNSLLAALAATEEAAGEIGQPSPPHKRGRQ